MYVNMAKAVEPGFEKFVAEMLSESTIVRPSGYSTLVVSIFGSVVGENDKKKAAYGILYHNRTVTRPCRLGKTIVKGQNVTCNVPELLAVVEAMEAAIGWGEGAITIRSRKRYVVDGIIKYANKPSRDRRIQRSHENIWVQIEDMSEECEIAGIHIEKWTADAFICRSRDEADQGLVCARNRMSQAEALPAAILVRIVNDEGGVITERANLSQIVLQSMQPGNEGEAENNRVNTRNPTAKIAAAATTKQTGKERVKRKSRIRSVTQLRFAQPGQSKFPRSHSVGKKHTETPLPSSSDDETRYISPIRPAAPEYRGESIVIIQESEDTKSTTGNRTDSAASATRNGGKRTRNYRSDQLSDEEDSHWGKIRKNQNKTTQGTQEQLSEFNIATQQMQLALSQTTDTSTLHDAQITHISVHCSELQLADTEEAEELDIERLTITSTPLPPHNTRAAKVFTTPRKHNIQGVEKKIHTPDTPLRRSTRIKRPSAKMAEKMTGDLFDPPQSLEDEIGYTDMTTNVTVLSGEDLLASDEEMGSPVESEAEDELLKETGETGQGGQGETEPDLIVVESDSEGTGPPNQDPPQATGDAPPPIQAEPPTPVAPPKTPSKAKPAPATPAKRPNKEKKQAEGTTEGSKEHGTPHRVESTRQEGAETPENNQPQGEQTPRTPAPRAQPQPVTTPMDVMDMTSTKKRTAESRDDNNENDDRRQLPSSSERGETWRDATRDPREPQTTHTSKRQKHQEQQTDTSTRDYWDTTPGLKILKDILQDKFEAAVGGAHAKDKGDLHYMEEIRNKLDEVLRKEGKNPPGDDKAVVEALKDQSQSLKDIKLYLNIPDSTPNQADRKLLDKCSKLEQEVNLLHERANLIAQTPTADPRDLEVLKEQNETMQKQWGVAVNNLEGQLAEADRVARVANQQANQETEARETAEKENRVLQSYIAQLEGERRAASEQAKLMSTLKTLFMGGDATPQPQQDQNQGETTEPHPQQDQGQGATYRSPPQLTRVTAPPTTMPTQTGSATTQHQTPHAQGEDTRVAVLKQKPSPITYTPETLTRTQTREASSTAQQGDMKIHTHDKEMAMEEGEVRDETRMSVGDAQTPSTNTADDAGATPPEYKQGTPEAEQGAEGGQQNWGDCEYPEDMEAGGEQGDNQYKYRDGRGEYTRRRSPARRDSRQRDGGSTRGRSPSRHGHRHREGGADRHHRQERSSSRHREGGADRHHRQERSSSRHTDRDRDRHGDRDRDRQGDRNRDRHGEDRSVERRHGRHSDEQERGHSHQKHTSSRDPSWDSRESRDSDHRRGPKNKQNYPKTELRVFFLHDDFCGQIEKADVVTPELRAYVSKIKAVNSTEVKETLYPEKNNTLDAIIIMTLLENGADVASSHWPRDFGDLKDMIIAKLKIGGVVIFSAPPGSNSSDEARRSRAAYRYWLIPRILDFQQIPPNKIKVRVLENRHLLDENHHLMVSCSLLDGVDQKCYTDTTRRYLTSPIRKILSELLQAETDKRVEERRQRDERKREDRETERRENQERQTRRDNEVRERVEHERREHERYTLTKENLAKHTKGSHSTSSPDSHRGGARPWLGKSKPAKRN